MANIEFQKNVNELLGKYDGTPLVERWNEAVAFGKKDQADNYWIRDSEEVVNIVWLSSDGIRDITWLPDVEESMFNYITIPKISALEVRESEDVGRKAGFSVSGSYMVRVFHTMQAGGLGWIAENNSQKKSLQAFISAVFNAYTLNSQR